VIATFTRTAETVATLQLVLDELGKMAAEGPTEDEVAAAIANLAGGYGLRLAGAGDLAAALATAEMHGLSQAYVSDFPVLLSRVPAPRPPTPPTRSSPRSDRGGAGRRRREDRAAARRGQGAVRQGGLHRSDRPAARGRGGGAGGGPAAGTKKSSTGPWRPRAATRSSS